MNRIKSLIPLILFLLVISCSTSKEEKKESKIIKTNLWEQGKGNYNGYRIPSLITTKQGTVLAFCEGREAGDAGNIDLLLKRSTDNGLSWGDEIVVWDDSANTCGNPCPVVDESTGRIWLFMTWNLGTDHEAEIIQRRSKFPRIPYLCYSDDDGLSWSKPVDISETCRDTSWGWYATGPGVGIQIKKGEHAGRLVIPANHSYFLPGGSHHENYEYGTHVIFSDDKGKTWQRSQRIGARCNESQVAELTDGSLIMNMRSYHNQNARAISLSNDGGSSWSEITNDLQLVESVCQASIINFGNYEGKNMHLFLNPAVPHSRTHLTLKASFDDCDIWSNSKLIFAGNSAYSSLTKLSNGKIGLFFENGIEHPYEKMTFWSLDVDLLFEAGNL